MQRHEQLRRSRKSLLSELSSLVKTAKRLQDAQGIVTTVEINSLVDEMILRAFKVVIKGVRFLDILEDDRMSRLPAVNVLSTLPEEGGNLWTAPAGSAVVSVTSSHTFNAESRVRESSGYVGRPARSPSRDVVRNHTSNASRLSVATLQQGANARRLSQNSVVQTNRLSSTISHRVSLAGLPSYTQAHKLVSERLNTCHDIFLSHLGSFIGRLQLQSQSRPSLSIAIRQSATSGGDLLVVVDVVRGHSSTSIDALEQARTAMYDRIQDLVHTARDILAHPGSDVDDDVIVPDDNGRLLGAATGCVKATGECVAKTRWVIERIGDFEFEFENGSLGISFDGLDDLSFVTDSKTKDKPQTTADVGSVPEPSAARSPTTESPKAASCSDTSRSRSTSIDKPLPELPQEADSPVSETPDVASSLPATTPSVDANVTCSPISNISTVSSLRPDLPPLPKISTSLPPESYDAATPSATQDSEFRSFRSESMTASSSGSGSTYLSRDSESSIVSQTSTRATTPDNAPLPKNQPSLSDLSVTDSTAHTEDEEVESKLLEKTYAHELVFNKEGQVTGGSLPALVERLTAHESTPDAIFVSTFYLTFRLFCTPVSFTEALIDRFDYVGEAPHIAQPVRLRTYNAFKCWLESHWREDADRDALPLIKQFAESKLSPVLPSAGKRLLELVQKVSVADGTLVPRLVSSMGKTTAAISPCIPADAPLPPPVLSRSQANALSSWKAGGNPPSILDFDPLEIARQLTLKQMSLFCSITPDELLGSKWTKMGGVGAPNVKAMSSFTTGLSNFVAESILQFEEVKKRAQVIKQWIKIAHQCHALRNYDALMAITCALTDTSIKRLKFTWDNVSLKRKEQLKSLQATVDINQNYKALRAQLHGQVPPCLPFLGMFLTDLTFVDVGNPATKTTNTGLTVINFDKHMRTAKCIGELQRFQIPYRLTELPDLQDWLTWQVERGREQDKPGSNAQASHYRKSLLLEPREAMQLRTPVDPTPNSATGSGMFGWMRGNSHPAHV